MSRQISSISRFGLTEPFELQVARGQISGHNVQFKFGNNPSVGNTEETIWTQGGIYSYPPSASTMTLSSSSADDSASGTGARTVSVSGLDANYNEISETVTLNGQTPVSTTQSFLRVFRMVVLTAGSSGGNAGIIYTGTGTVTAGVPTNIYAIIDGVKDNQTLMMVWTVPAGYTAYLYQAHMSTGNSSSTPTVLNARIVARPYGGVFNTKATGAINDGTLAQSYSFPLPFEEKTDIEIRAISSSGSVTFNVSASCEFIYIKNGAL